MAADSATTRTATVVSLEGLPGAGKTTQARRLADRLVSEGRTVAYLPDLATLRVDPFGDRLFELFACAGDPFRRHGSLLTDTLLAAAIRAHIVGAVIEPACTQHEILIEDRGVHTMYSYSLATAAREHRDLPAEDLLKMLGALGGLAGRQADVALWLSLPVGTAIHRTVGRGDSAYTGEQAAYLYDVDEAYQRLAVTDPRVLRIPVDGLDRDQVHDLLYREISRRLP